MNEEAFCSWLSASLGAGTIRSRLANCRTVQDIEGDLDEHFNQDRLCGLLKLLSYSKPDERERRPARHRIPINGNVYNGTATLKSAVSLYKRFCESRVEVRPVSCQVIDRAKTPTSSSSKKSLEGRTWPAWEQPDPEKVLAMAHLIIPFVRFLDPQIVRAIVEDNELNRTEWIEALAVRQINPAAYLWNKSSCTFPGVRRYAGSHEIAAYRGHASLDKGKSFGALALDDNDYPKQLWSFVFRGQQFSKSGPGGYSLAHLADHKDHKNRFNKDFVVLEDIVGPRSLFGLYTCPSNTVYIPTNLIKPTDFAGTIRGLLFRRAQDLYGAFCNILPPFLHLPEKCSPEWNVCEFRWADPVGTSKHIPDFLGFRRERLLKLFTASNL